MKIVGLDLSLTTTGIADMSGTRVLAPPKPLASMARLSWLRTHILAEIPVGDAIVIIEGYSYGTARKASAYAHAIAELGGVVRLALYDHAISYVDVAPASLKRYATGAGNANKGQVLEAAIRRSGLAFDGDHNRADAWWLRQLGLAHYAPDHPDLIAVPTTNRAALDKVTWPTIPEGRSRRAV